MLMKHVIILTAALAIATAGLGCSSTAVEENTTASANSAAAIDFTTITDPNVALAEGKRLLDENQTDQAIAALKRAIELNPDLAEAHFQLGIAYALLELQHNLEGTAEETAADNSGSENSNARGERKKTASERSFERAVEAYKKWVDANPKDDVAYYNMGRAYSKLMKDEEAKDAFQEAVKLKPDDAEYQTELGAILIKLAEYHKAIPPLKKAVELDPSNVRAQDLLEDAEAGRQRIDYVSPKNTNANTAKTDANSNSDTNTNSVSNSNTAPRRDTNTRANTQATPRPPAANRPANRPN